MSNITVTCESNGYSNEWSERKYCVQMCSNPAKDPASAKSIGVIPDPNSNFFIDHKFTCMDAYYEPTSMVKYKIIMDCSDYLIQDNSFIANCTNGTWIEQKCIPFQCSNLTFDDSSVDFEEDSNFEGIYVIGDIGFPPGGKSEILAYGVREVWWDLENQ